jgi:tetratricopeptide (TPR) repeat protein
MSRLAQLERLHAADPRDADVVYMLAQERAKLGETSAAAALFDRCLELDPAYHYAHFHKARALEAAGDERGAAAALRAGLASARAHGDAKAAVEMEGYLLQLGEDPGT